MFRIFGKKEMDKIAAKNFWVWFAENEEWIIQNLKTNGMEVVDVIDKELKSLFPYYKKELEFQLGFHEGKGEFFFFHMGNRSLMHDAGVLKGMMASKLQARWTFIIEK
jgi:hypothetical protein